MKTYPAPTTSQQVPYDGRALREAAFCRRVIAVLLLLHIDDTPIAITQADMDAAVGFGVMEGLDENGNFLIGLGVRQETSQ